MLISSLLWWRILVSRLISRRLTTSLRVSMSSSRLASLLSRIITRTRVLYKNWSSKEMSKLVREKTLSLNLRKSTPRWTCLKTDKSRVILASFKRRSSSLRRRDLRLRTISWLNLQASLKKSQTLRVVSPNMSRMSQTVLLHQLVSLRQAGSTVRSIILRQRQTVQQLKMTFRLKTLRTQVALEPTSHLSS